MLTFKNYITMEKNETKERITVKQYIIGLDYLFEEFDKCDYDGSYFTRWGKLGEFELFEEEQIDEAVEEYIPESEKKYLDEVSEEDIDDIICYLVDFLDRGAIKFLEIKDGDKVLYEDSNDEPFED